MTIRFTQVQDNEVAKARHLNDMGNNQVVQVSYESELEDTSLEFCNIVYCLQNNSIYTRVATGVGADKWKALWTPSPSPATKKQARARSNSLVGQQFPIAWSRP